MAIEKVLNTRLQMKYDSYANWTSETLGDGKGAKFVLKAGEIGICYLPTNYNENQVVGSQPPQILFKVGNGSSKFSELPWASAKAADVYEWAKQASLPVTKEGNGNVVASIAWDESTKGIKFTTASVATSEGMEQLANRVTVIENGYATDGDLSAAVEIINAAIALKADKTYVDTELAKYQLAGDYATKAEAKGYADAKDEAIAAAKKSGDDAQANIGDMEAWHQFLEELAWDFPVDIGEKTIVDGVKALFTEGLTHILGNMEDLADLISEIDSALSQGPTDPNIVAAILALKAYLEYALGLYNSVIGDPSELGEDATIIGTLSDAVESLNDVVENKIPGIEDIISNLQEDLSTYKTNNNAAVALKADKTALDAVAAVANAAATQTALTEEINRAKAAEKANADAITLLTNGVDQDKVDSVKDLIAYVEEHGPEVEQMQKDIVANTKAISDEATRADTEEKRLAGLIGDNDTAIKANAAAIAALNAEDGKVANAEKADVASSLDSEAIAQVKGIVVDKATDADTLDGHDSTYFATAAQGAKADSAVQPAALNDYYTKAQADAEFMNSNEVDAKITALNLAETYDAKGAAATAEANAIAHANGLASNYATAAQGAKADSALQEITTTANNGLKITNKNQIDIDTDVIFVFNCGDSRTVI